MTDPNFNEKLTIPEIQAEIDKIGDFFQRIPEELRAEAADRFIYEIVNQGCRDHYQALGIFEEAKNRYRKVSLQVLEEAAEEERIEMACENSSKYKCFEKLELTDGKVFNIGDYVFAAYGEEDENFSGGAFYDVFLEDGTHRFLCKTSFESHFELVEEEEGD